MACEKCVGEPDVARTRDLRYIRPKLCRLSYWFNTRLIIHRYDQSILSKCHDTCCIYMPSCVRPPAVSLQCGSPGKAPVGLPYCLSHPGRGALCGLCERVAQAASRMLGSGTAVRMPASCAEVALVVFGPSFCVARVVQANY